MVEVTIITIEQAKEAIRRYTRFAYSNLVDPDKVTKTYKKPKQVSIKARDGRLT